MGRTNIIQVRGLSRKEQGRVPGSGQVLAHGGLCADGVEGIRAPCKRVAGPAGDLKIKRLGYLGAKNSTQGLHGIVHDARV